MMNLMSVLTLCIMHMILNIVIHYTDSTINAQFINPHDSKCRRLARPSSYMCSISSPPPPPPPPHPHNRGVKTCIGDIYVIKLSFITCRFQMTAHKNPHLRYLRSAVCLRFISTVSICLCLFRPYLPTIAKQNPWK